MVSRRLTLIQDNPNQSEPQKQIPNQNDSLQKDQNSMKVKYSSQIRSKRLTITQENPNKSETLQKIPNQTDSVQKAQSAIKVKYLYQKRQQQCSLYNYGKQLGIGTFVTLISSLVIYSIFLQKKSQVNLNVNDPTNLVQVDPDYTVAYSSFFEVILLKKNMTFQSTKPMFKNLYSYKGQVNKCNIQMEQFQFDFKYDFRQSFPNCINPVQQQEKNCSSSYAITVASTLTNSICQFSQQSINIELSHQYLLACDKQNNGCLQGNLVAAAEFAMQKGLKSATCDQNQPNNVCNIDLDQCATFFAQSFFFIQDYCITNDAINLKAMIKTVGPAIILIPVYQEFLVYKSGVYNLKNVEEGALGTQAIKIIGWDDQMGYWIVENTWGTEWGMEGYGMNLEDFNQGLFGFFVVSDQRYQQQERNDDIHGDDEEFIPNEETQNIQL